VYGYTGIGRFMAEWRAARGAGAPRHACQPQPQRDMEAADPARICTCTTGDILINKRSD